MIELRNLYRRFVAGDVETTALRDVSIKVDAGEFVAVMGPSGCGKSTLLNILGLIDKPSSGEYIFDGVDVTSMAENKLVEVRKHNVGFIFQSFNLIEDLTVVENVELPMMYQRISKQERRGRALEILEKVDLAHRASHRPEHLSGGQQQRVAIARAIVAKPKILLADEPTGNLDTKNGNDVMRMLEELSGSGMSIVMVTHSREEGSRAHRMIDMLDGEITQHVETKMHSEG
jgi:putative ABC transport system ATP-binding protein